MMLDGAARLRPVSPRPHAWWNAGAPMTDNGNIYGAYDVNKQAGGAASRK